MSLTLTVILMLAGLALFAFAAWRGGRPADPLKPRLIPWNLVAIFAGAFVLIVGAHLLSFFGIETGQGRPRF